MAKTSVQYDQLQLLASEHRASLLSDLRQRTGIDVKRVRVQDIDLGSGTATLTIYYRDEPQTQDGKTIEALSSNTDAD